MKRVFGRLFSEVLIRRPKSNKKEAQRPLFCWSGREDCRRYTPSHRRNFCLKAKPAIPASRLLLVVEPPFPEVLIRRPKANKKEAQRPLFCWSGREDCRRYTPSHRRNFCLKAKPAIPASRLLLVVEPPFPEVLIRRPKANKKRGIKPLFLLVGTRGFEPPTSCTPCKRSTRLNYVPKNMR